MVPIWLSLLLPFAVAQDSPASGVSLERSPEKGIRLDDRRAARLAAHVYVVAIGVDDFKHLGPGQDLRFAESDATEFVRVLRRAQPAIRNEDVFMLVGADATHERISAAVRDVLTRATPSDVVILYFSTHGVVYDGAGYLIAVDTEVTKALASTALGTRDLDAWIAGSAADHVVLFTDACHSGITGSAAFGHAVNQLSGGTTSLFNMASSLTSQTSQESEEFCGGHGAFTCWLMKAIEGGADVQDGEEGGNGDGYVSLGELSTWTTRKVKIATRSEQIPETKGIYDPDQPLAQNVTEHAWLRPEDQDGVPKMPRPPRWRVTVGGGAGSGMFHRDVDADVRFRQTETGPFTYDTGDSGAITGTDSASLSPLVSFAIGYRRAWFEPTLTLGSGVASGTRSALASLEYQADSGQTDKTVDLLEGSSAEAPRPVPSASLSFRLHPVFDRRYQRVWAYASAGVSARYVPGIPLPTAAICTDGVYDDAGNCTAIETAEGLSSDPSELEEDLDSVDGQIELYARGSVGLDIVLGRIDPLKRDEGGWSLSIEVPVSHLVTPPVVFSTLPSGHNGATDPTATVTRTAPPYLVEVLAGLSYKF